MALLRSCRHLMPGLKQQLHRNAAAGIRASSSSADNSSSSSNTSTSTTSSTGSSSVPAKQPKPASSKSGGGEATGEEWTEVIDEKSGQPYYWNQKTGETTDLGEPKPNSRFRDRDWQEAAAGSGPFQEGWREPPGRDLTYLYSMLGAGVGIAVGWASQYMH